MNELSEIASRILTELEEAGAENVTSTMNTILDAQGGAAELSEIEAALNELVTAGLAVIGYAEGESTKITVASKEKSLADIGDFSRLLSYRIADHLWVWDEAVPLAQIVATQSGMTQARQLLEQRGYQWWKSRS